MAIEPPSELIDLQRASDAAHEAVRRNPSDESWAVWRERAGEVQAAVTAYAAELGEPRNQVEAAVKKRARYPEPPPEA